MSYHAVSNQGYKMNEMLLKQINEHFNCLLNKYSKLVMFRVDFSYKKETQRYNQQSYLLIDNDINLLMQRIMEETKVTGYFWVVESNKQYKLHIHAIFYLNGQCMRKAYPVLQQIGNLWGNITNGDGYYHYCKPNEEYCEVIGERIINHRDSSMINQTRYILSYLAKEQQKNGRYIFGCNQVAPHSGRGRPRNI